MNFIKTEIDDVYIIEPKIFEDSRGYFFESYSKKIFSEFGLNYDFIQDNQSKSNYGTIRGLHFQKCEYSQAKLIHVLDGLILDVAVDLRINSKTFGKYVAVELSSEDQKQLLIPRDFAHGFSVLSDIAIIAYKCDNYYNKESERGIYFNDNDLKINWKIDTNSAILSEKDKKYPNLKDINL